MDKDTLRKVQMVQLEIAKEIKRVCEENNIKFFLFAGTLLGAIRHQGFIPWDDDLDIAMLKEDYDKFIKIAPKVLKPHYEIQNWYTDLRCPYEFTKVRKKGTIFVEEKARVGDEPGIYVDVFVLVNMPDNEKEIQKAHNEMVNLHRLLLMKCGFQPWRDNGIINWKKRMGYYYYQLVASLVSYRRLVKRFESIQNKYLDYKNNLHEQVEGKKFTIFKRVWFDNTVLVSFEDEMFPVPREYKKCLSTLYGDYLQLPPESERENRHQIIKLSFGKEK